MILHSTKGSSPHISLRDGIVSGLAPDGGLYMPDSLPKIPNAFFCNIAEMSLADIAYVVLNTLFGNFISSGELKKIVDDSLNFDIPLKNIGGNLFALELFHGPTLSFKDVGARFMARLLPLLTGGNSGCGRNIILATSGDSGGAVANGFLGRADVHTFVLFPKKDLSREQIAQFATLDNVCAIEVAGTFDDCQALVKQALVHKELFPDMPLTSGNSINLVRQLPSIIYYFYAYAQAVVACPDANGVVISVPCGNLGNLSAGLMAKKMGLPVERFVAANNANDVFVEYLQTGGFRPQRALMTLARAMDVGNPSNIARIIDLYDGNLQNLRRDVEGVAYSDEEIASTMRGLYNDCGYLIDPQGATAYRALSEHIRGGEVGVALMSAHPVKFRQTVKTVTGVDVEIPVELQSLLDKPVRIMKIPPTLPALARIIKGQ